MRKSCNLCVQRSANFGDGNILPQLRTTEEVARDSEVLVSYDYAVDEAPPWYQELYAKRILDQYHKSKHFYKD